jgi:hypothetical protein
MRNRKGPSTVLAVTSGIATFILIAGATIMVTSRQTMANTEIANKTGQPCSQCHTTAPALNDYGKKYQDSLKK